MAHERIDTTDVIFAFRSFAAASETLKKVQKLVCGLLRETRFSFVTCIVCVSLTPVFWGGRGCPVLVWIRSNFSVSQYEMSLFARVEKFARPLQKDYVTGMG